MWTESGQDPSLKLSIVISVTIAQVRIFPYLIGRESAFADNLKWMACANKGLRRLTAQYHGVKYGQHVVSVH